VPLNVDVSPKSQGSHWLLAIINLKQKDIIICDSLQTHVSQQTKLIMMRLLKLVCAVHVVGNLIFQPQQWNFLLSSDSPQQSNSFDCGCYTIVNAYSIITGKVYEMVPGNSVRKWITLLLVKDTIIERRFTAKMAGV